MAHTVSCPSLATEAGPVKMRFMVDKMEVDPISLQVFLLSPVTTIPPMLYNHSVILLSTLYNLNN
jgi:hypothetical protein